MNTTDLLGQIREFLTPNTSISADDMLMSIVDHLFSEPVESDPETMSAILTALHRIAPHTWWHCACGPLCPTNALVDAICPICGQIRTLPTRLSFPVWTAYVMAFRRLAPNTWFDQLKTWAQQQHLSLEPGSSTNALSEASHETSLGQIEFIDGMVIHADGRVCGSNWIALPLPDVTQMHT